mmetsp:Transcript_102631/g.244640  ORF Transcript_102631/g.244640 Transcript_102631/m.244640 type:complete len:214 (-) Transcript_102631:495-1136(-)
MLLLSLLSLALGHLLFHLNLYFFLFLLVTPLAFAFPVLPVLVRLPFPLAPVVVLPFPYLLLPASLPVLPIIPRFPPAIIVIFVAMGLPLSSGSVSIPGINLRVPFLFFLVLLNLHPTWWRLRGLRLRCHESPLDLAQHIWRWRLTGWSGLRSRSAWLRKSLGLARQRLGRIRRLPVLLLFPLLPFIIPPFLPFPFSLLVVALLPILPIIPVLL